MPHNVGSREHLINKNIGRVSAVGNCFAIIVGNVSRRISQSILYLKLLRTSTTTYSTIHFRGIYCHWSKTKMRSVKLRSNLNLQTLKNFYAPLSNCRMQWRSFRNFSLSIFFLGRCKKLIKSNDYLLAFARSSNSTPQATAKTSSRSWAIDLVLTVLASKFDHASKSGMRL